MLACGMSVDSVMMLFVAIELLVAVARIPFLKFTAGLSIRAYLRDVLMPLLPQLAVACITSLILSSMLHFRLHSLVTLPVSIAFSLVALWTFTLDRDERAFAKRLITSRFSHDH